MAASDRAQTWPAGQRPSKGKKERAYGSRRSPGLGLQGKWPVGHPTRSAVLIRQREPPLGQRSQRSVGTWLDPLCALGTLKDSVHQAAVDLNSIGTVCQGVILSSQYYTNLKDFIH